MTTTIFHTPSSLARAIGTTLERVMEATSAGELTPAHWARVGLDRMIPLYAPDAASRFRGDKPAEVGTTSRMVPTAIQLSRQLLEEDRSTSASFEPVDEEPETYLPSEDHGWNQPVQVEARPSRPARSLSVLQTMMNRSSTPEPAPEKKGQECLHPDCKIVTWTKTQLYCSPHWKLLTPDLQRSLNNAVFNLVPEDEDYQEAVHNAAMYLNQVT